MAKTAIIIGASGLVGNEVLKLLLTDDHFDKVNIFVRKPLSINHPKLEQHAIDFDLIFKSTDLVKGDILFCCLGTTIKTAGSKEEFKKVDYAYPLAFAKIAKQNGVKKFLIISSIGANSTSSNFYLKVKGGIEKELEKLKYESLIIVRPSMLLGDRKEFRLGESIGKIVMKLISILFIGKFNKYKAIEASTVARAMIELSKSNLEGVSVVESDRLMKIVSP